MKISTDIALLIEENFHYSFRWLLTGQGPAKDDSTSVFEVNDTSAAYSQAVIDRELFTEIMVAIDQELDAAELELETAKKVEVAFLLYEIYAESDKNVDAGFIRRQLRLVA